MQQTYFRFTMEHLQMQRFEDSRAREILSAEVAQFEYSSCFGLNRVF